MPLVSEVTMVDAEYHFPPVLSSGHGGPLMSCGLVERLWLWWFPLCNTITLEVSVGVKTNMFNSVLIVCFVSFF